MKRRFIQDPNTFELIEVSEDYQFLIPNTDAALWNDRAYQDMGDPRFKSRSQHREFMARTGLTTADDYMGGEWRNREKQRIDIRNGVDPQRRGQIERAIYDLTEGKRNATGRSSS